jgi:hypothetical protein
MGGVRDVGRRGRHHGDDIRRRPPVGKVQAKYLIITGSLIIAASMYALTAVYGDFDFWFLARCRMFFGVGLPFAI